MELEDLYRRWAPDVHRFAFYLSGNRADADDLTAETFIRVWTAKDDLRLATVRSYLFAIAHHLFLDGVRRRGRHVEVTPELADPAPLPDREAAARSHLEAVLAALQRLPDVDRAALLLRALDAMPYEEIAAALRLSVSAAKVKVHRARLKLAAQLAEERKDDR